MRRGPSGELLSASPSRISGTEQRGKKVFLYELHVRLGQRGGGICTALMEMAERTARGAERTHDARWSSMSTKDNEMEKALGFYEDKCGFARCGEVSGGLAYVAPFPTSEARSTHQGQVHLQNPRAPNNSAPRRRRTRVTGGEKNSASPRPRTRGGFERSQYFRTDSHKRRRSAHDFALQTSQLKVVVTDDAVVGKPATLKGHCFKSVPGSSAADGPLHLLVRAARESHEAFAVEGVRCMLEVLTQWQRKVLDGCCLQVKRTSVRLLLSWAHLKVRWQRKSVSRVGGCKIDQAAHAWVGAGR